MSSRAGDIYLGDGDATSALEMYQRAGDLAAAHGSARSVIAVGAKMARAAPDRADTYLDLARKMVQHGHAAPAVDVLMEHAKRINSEELKQELQPLAGRASEDIKPLVLMLLEGSFGPPSPQVSDLPAGGVDQPAGAADMFPSPPPRKPEPVSRPEPVLPPPPPLPTWAAPPPIPGPTPPPPAEPAPPLVGPEVLPVDPGLELGSLVPASPRESQIIEMRARASEMAQNAPVEEEPPPPPPPSPRRRPSRRSMPRPSPVQAQRSGGKLWIVVALGLAGALAWLVVSGRVSSGGGPDGSDSAAVTPRPATPGAATPEPATPEPSSSQPGAMVLAETVPPVLVGGLTVDSIYSLPGVADGYRILHRDSSRALLELVVRPAADTIGEPVAGQVLLDVLPGDTGSATTMFEGYVVTLRGMRDPAGLGELLQRLFLVPRN